MREDTYRLVLNPAAATTKRRQPPPAVVDFYEPEEVEAVARAAEVGAHRDVAKLAYEESEQAARALEDRQDAELYRVAAYTGLRLGELLALRWADVNLVDRRLVVHRAFSDRTEGPTKSWQARFIPIADPAAGAFARLAERREFTRADDYVFYSRLGRPLDGSALRRRFKRAAAAVGLRELRFHALRHGAGSMIARQADPRWVQGFLGHSKSTTTERYPHSKARPEDVDVLNRAFAPNRPAGREGQAGQGMGRRAPRRTSSQMASTPAVVPDPAPPIAAIAVRPDHVVRVFFQDGEVREVDLTPTLGTPPFSALRDPDTFATAHVGAVTGGLEWTDDIGLDPDVIYAGLDLGLHAPRIQALVSAR